MGVNMGGAEPAAPLSLAHHFGRGGGESFLITRFGVEKVVKGAWHCITYLNVGIREGGIFGQPLPRFLGIE